MRLYHFVCNPHKHIIYGFYIATIIWGWIGFKALEPLVLPVVSDFHINAVDRQLDKVRIYGTMDKRRECTPIELLAYSKGALVGLTFTENDRMTSRVTGSQDWGWWIIVPAVDEVAIYARHECSTGSVLTKLHEGSL